MKKLKQTRAVTYRRYGVPALILEGVWLTEKYRLQIGDQVDIDYQPNEIILRKNNKLSLESRKNLKRKKEDGESITDESLSERSSETSEGESAGNS
jgi:hypothetical protein